VPQELNLKDRQDVGSKGRDTNWAEIDEVLWKIMSRCQCQVHGACLDARLPPTLLSTQLQKKSPKWEHKPLLNNQRLLPLPLQ
jgi:hypothetical protein